MSGLESFVWQLAFGALTVAFIVLWWLLRQKDSQQQEEIRLLWEKHDDDAERLRQLEREIDKNHYIKTELDVKFDQLTRYFKEGMDGLGAKFDKMTESLFNRRDPQ